MEAGLPNPMESIEGFSGYDDNLAPEGVMEAWESSPIVV